MAAFLTASLVLFLLVFSFSVSADQRNITAEPGDNVILPCRAAENKDVRGVEWSRTDLESGQYVLLHRNNRFDPEGQSPSFKNRVDLQDVKKGNVSLVLKNVKTNDTGTYECRVFEKGKNRRKRSNQKSISTIKLIVQAGNKDGGNKDGQKEDGGNKDGPKEDGGNKDGPKEDGGNKDGPKEGGGSLSGLMVGASVCAVVALLVAAVLYERSRYSSLKSKRPPAAADAEKKLTGPDE